MQSLELCLYFVDSTLCNAISTRSCKISFQGTDSMMQHADMFLTCRITLSCVTCVIVSYSWSIILVWPHTGLAFSQRPVQHPLPHLRGHDSSKTRFTPLGRILIKCLSASSLVGFSFFPPPSGPQGGSDQDLQLLGEKPEWSSHWARCGKSHVQHHEERLKSQLQVFAQRKGEERLHAQR